MQIINRSSMRVYWRVFNPDDWACVAGLCDGYLGPSDSAGYGAGKSVQMEIRNSNGMPDKMGWTRGSIVDATRNRVFNDSSIIVFTLPNQLIELDSDIQSKLSLTPPPGGAPANPLVKVDFTKVVTAVLSLASTLVSGLWPKAMDATKWTQASVFNIATSLTTLFGPTAANGSPADLNLDSIANAVQTIVDQDDARNQVPVILNSLAWFNRWLAKSRNTAPNNLSDYDRGMFVGQLNDLLAPVSPFLTAMSLLQENRNIRKYVISTYLIGALLHLHLLRLNLCITQQNEPLDPTDIQAVYQTQQDYLGTLDEMEQDYVGLCKTLFDKYPLMNQSMYVGRGRSDVVQVFNPTPVEGLALADYAINKWLAGDRMLIAKAGDQLRTLKLT